MLGLIKYNVYWITINIVSASDHTKCVSLNNHKCMTQSSLPPYLQISIDFNCSITYYGETSKLELVSI